MVNHLTRDPFSPFGCTRALHALNIASAAGSDNLVLAGSPSGATRSGKAGAAKQICETDLERDEEGP